MVCDVVFGVCGVLLVGGVGAPPEGLSGCGI